MDAFKRKTVNADDTEYNTVVAGLREKLYARLSHLTESDRIQLMQYYDMQAIIEKEDADRIRKINRHITRIQQDHKQILMVMRTSRHAKVNRQSYS